ncbi:MAG: endolytic transglycosylase MltG [Candidatus Peregrinibacteria bacterium]
MKKNLKIVSVVVLLVGIFVGWYFNAVNVPLNRESDETISFLVKKGSVASEIGAGLEDAGLIRSDLAFSLYVRFNGLAQDVIAGRFLLSPGMSIGEIAEVITDPAQAEFVITVQEGLRVLDIEKKLVDLELVKEGEFVEGVKNFDGWEFYWFLEEGMSLEGYLFPDTYFLDPVEFEPHDLIYLMLDNFEGKIEEFRGDFGDRTLAEIVNMASIIETEVVGEEDRKIVSGILWKRLDADWALGADATLLYITEDRVISAKDLEIDSLYNTRKNKGLPPTPIGNPGLSSLKAAIFPEESEYWFYLTTLDTGEVVYAKTNEEHNENKRKYL